ncbi:MAG: hypothetical protein WKF43_11635, partial [Acidimicrobiales bacterium]
YRALRKRLEERGERVARRSSREELEADLAEPDAERAGPGGASAAAGPTVGAATKARTGSTARPAGAQRGDRPGTYSANHPPRPRKKGKRR